MSKHIITIMGCLVALSSLACYEVHVDQCDRNEAFCEDNSAQNCRDLYDDGRLFLQKDLCYRSCLVVTNESNRPEAVCVEETSPDPTCQREGDGTYCNEEGPFTCRLGYVTSQQRCPYSAACEPQESQTEASDGAAVLVCGEPTEDAPHCEGVPEGTTEYRCIEGSILARCDGPRSVTENRCIDGFSCPDGESRCQKDP